MNIEWLLEQYLYTKLGIFRIYGSITKFVVKETEIEFWFSNTRTTQIVAILPEFQSMARRILERL